MQRFLSLLYLAASLLLANAALSSSDVSAVMGTSLKGQTLPASAYQDFSITLVSNGTYVLFALEIAKSAASIGWMAVGIGGTMLDSELYVTWPNQQDWVVSHREASSYVMPTVLSKGSESITLVPALYSSNTVARVAFVRPLTGDGLTAITEAAQFTLIYAYCTQKPSSPSDPKSTIQEHDGFYQSTTINLAQSFAGGGSSGNANASLGTASSGSTISQTGPASDATGSLSTPDSSNDTSLANTYSGSITETPTINPNTLIAAHVALGVLAWGGIAPLAVLVARWRFGKAGEKQDGTRIAPIWVRIHEFLQKYLLTGCTIACVALGSSYVTTKKSLHFNSTHQLSGALLTIFLLIQITLGWVIHHLFSAELLWRPLRNVIHMVLGICLLGLGFFQLHSGLELAKLMGVDLPATLMYGYYALVGITAFFWVVSVLLLIKGRAAKFKTAGDPSAFFTAIFGLGARKTLKVWDPSTQQGTFAAPSVGSFRKEGSQFSESTASSIRKR